jgi:hypothetical protein
VSTLLHANVYVFIQFANTDCNTIAIQIANKMRFKKFSTQDSAYFVFSIQAKYITYFIPLNFAVLAVLGTACK